MGKHASKKPKRQQRGGHRKPVMSSAKAKKATKNGPARGAAANALTQAELGPSTSKNLQKMEQLWHKVCSHYDVPEQVASEWFERIQKHLSQESPTRAYHNWQHMMQRKLVHLTPACSSKPVIVLAAFFQYYHFDGNRSCVQQNCEVFEEFCQDALIEDEQVKNLVCNLLGRKRPENELTLCYDEEANLLQDVDLVVLAAPPEEYKHYTQLLRSEYTNLDDANYTAMRVKVLETLLMIPCIFATNEYREKYEELARANIRNEITELKQ